MRGRRGRWPADWGRISTKRGEEGHPRAAAFRTGGDEGAIWQGPFADECTAKLHQRQRTLSGMGTALLADATRWEGQADELDRQAGDKTKAGTGGS
ncbi:hypothetical protein [Streptomyces hawaiiensis]|uniref:hypothetical protein n=1 Tax=Streptomyces hawaiiensis TaxID=67305 RepID=UPI0036648473